MHNLDTADLRRQAAASARVSQRRLRWSLFTIHGFFYLAALAVMAVMLLGLPAAFRSLWNSVDMSLMVFGLFAGWSIGLALHGGSLIVDSSWAERQLRNRAATDMVGRALLDDDAEIELAAKAKRIAADEMVYSLADDGELMVAGEGDHAHRQ